MGMAWLKIPPNCFGPSPSPRIVVNNRGWQSPEMDLFSSKPPVGGDLSKPAWDLTGNFSWIASKIRSHIYKHSFLWLIYYFCAVWDKSIIVNTGSRTWRTSALQNYRLLTSQVLDWCKSLSMSWWLYFTNILRKYPKYPYQLGTPHLELLN